MMKHCNWHNSFKDSIGLNSVNSSFNMNAEIGNFFCFFHLSCCHLGFNSGSWRSHLTGQRLDWAAKTEDEETEWCKVSGFKRLNVT